MRERRKATSSMLIAATAALLLMGSRISTLPTGAALSAFAEEGLLFSQEQDAHAVASSTEPEQTPAPPEKPAFQVEVIIAAPVPTAVPKKILIYHSHTYEAYTQVADAPYVETEKWRTKDATANVVAVGRALAAALTAMGHEVTHDETAFEPPELSSAYVRSLEMLEARRSAGEQYDLYIDLHRDAFDSPDAIKRVVNIGGENVARFMVLIGKGTGLTGDAYSAKPEWEKNYAIAEVITDSLNGQAESLARSICLRTGRFNQHIAPCCILIECGSNHNTLQEVLNGVPYLAQAISDALQQNESAPQE